MLRRCLTLFFSLMLVVTSHNMAQARGAEPAVDRMVICAGARAVTVYVDATGEPTQAPHMCPDCALHGLGVLSSVAPVLEHAPVFTHHAAGEVALAVRLLAYGRALARAPPVLI
ncbi:hypothetical protein [Tateyamaria sp.]|uniref:hypothetical protein n=1 Tax=Tateyamaria sp. TaxID=1929288 RepID=UPI00329FA28F